MLNTPTELHYVPPTITGSSGALAATLAAFSSLGLLFATIFVWGAGYSLATGSEAVLGALFLGVVTVVVGAVFVPIAALLGAFVGWLRVPDAGWFVGPGAGVLIGYALNGGSADSPGLIAAGFVFGLVNAAFFARFERRYR